MGKYADKVTKLEIRLTTGQITAKEFANELTTLAIEAEVRLGPQYTFISLCDGQKVGQVSDTTIDAIEDFVFCSCNDPERPQVAAGCFEGECTSTKFIFDLEYDGHAMMVLKHDDATDVVVAYRTKD